MNIRQTIILRKAWAKEDFFNTKINVNPEQSKKLQEYLFGIGIKWPYGEVEITNERHNYLYIKKQGILTYGESYDIYQSNTAREIKFEDIVFEDETAQIGETVEFSDDGKGWRNGIIVGFEIRGFMMKIMTHSSCPFNYARKLRVPEKKYVPLSKDDIDLHKFILRHKDGTYYSILFKNEHYLYFGCGGYAEYELLFRDKDYEMSLDNGKTWQPCRKEVSNG